jgi:membrane-bound lytic murein transglycosylase MltF
MRTFVLILCSFLLAWRPIPAPAAGSAEGSESAESAANVLLEHAHEPWKGGLDGILERGFLRAATANSPLFFLRDGMHETGFAVEIARELEAYLDKTYPKKGRRMNVVLMPLARDAILPAVREGRADFAFGNLTITPERSESVAFTRPTWKNVSELVVSGPAAPGIESLDDLAATGLHLRPSSSYFEHVSTLNQARDAAGKLVIPVESMDEHLEDYDLLEMVQAGILPAIIVDSHKAAILARVFDNITVHEDLSVNEGGEIAWAVRKDNPKLLSALNGFVGQVRKGSLLGNILIKRYLGDQDWIDNVQSEDALGRYKESLGFIQKYAGQYEFDWLMIVAQGFQESKLDQSKRSKAGAIGIMQVMPATANDRVVGIPDIENAESNVHAGVKYLRFLRKRYFDGTEIAPLDRVLFAFAAYNAGPGGIRKARKRASKMGLDPNRWFDNVEIAAARSISREPVIYVRNIYKYYVAYQLLETARATQEKARDAPGGG